MSIYAYLTCHDCRHLLWLGKALHEKGQPYAFHAGNEPTPQWRRESLNKVLWKSFWPSTRVTPLTCA